mgnify:CR=1
MLFHTIYVITSVFFSYERFEVLAVFTGTILAMFGALFIAKERLVVYVYICKVDLARY